MAKVTRSSIYVVMVVVMSQAAIQVSQADAAPAPATRESLLPPRVELEWDELKTLRPSLEQLALLNSVGGPLANRDDDHSNIELGKLMEAHRYEVVPATAARSSPADAYSLARLFSRIANLNRVGELARSQVERKRNIRQLIKEDKDYSFVGIPINKYGQQLYQQRQDPNWAAQKLRDSALTNDQTFRYLTGDGGVGRDWEQANMRLNSDSRSANEIMPKNREKRRRCKIDPNLGVKNPSFCDTDAYFGAADYSMRDVWDSAGR